MEAKHTPGPWEVVNRLDVFTGLGADSGDGINADNNDGWQICDCSGGSTSVNGEDVSLSFAIKAANARLIAAAPDLLEALLPIADGVISAKIMLAAKSAIAKATGASHE